MKKVIKSKSRIRSRRPLLLLGAFAAIAALISINSGAAAQDKTPVIANRTGTQIDAPTTGPLISSCTAPSTVCSSSSGINAACKITTSGAYKLIGNVPQSSANTDGIQIQASHVTLNLNGYRVSGPQSGSCIGIDACPSGSCNTDITLMNGTVTNFGGAGVQLGASGNGGEDIVRQVKSYSNGEGSSGGTGITLGDNSLADYNISYCNGWEESTSCSGSGSGDGLDCGANCVLEANVVDSNAGNGIVGGSRDNEIFNSISNNQTNMSEGMNSGYCNNSMYNGSVANTNSSGTETCTNLCTGTGGTC